MTKVGIFALGATLFFSSCMSDDDSGKPLNDTLQLNISGLKDLGPDEKYQAWVMVNGEQISAGDFTVNANGALSQKDFLFNREQLNNASGFTITIEPAQDTNPLPSGTTVLAGSFSGNQANLSVEQPEAVGADLSAITGTYVLATPTTADNSDENRGLWFAKVNALGNYGAGFANLPALGSKWQYEGWVVINGVPYSTGKFNNASGQDLGSKYGGPQGGIQFPGEDFVNGAAAGVTFPQSLAGSQVFVSVEPIPDNDPLQPFMIQPLKATIPANAVSNSAYALTNQTDSALPQGTVSR